MCVTKAQSSKSEEVCSTTLKPPERPEKVLEEVIRALWKEEKQMMLTEAGVTLDINAKTGLAMKGAFGILGIKLGL